MFSDTILDINTSEEERLMCLKDLHKRRHSVAYYEWLQKFVDDLRGERYFSNRTGEHCEDKGE